MKSLSILLLAVLAVSGEKLGDIEVITRGELSPESVNSGSNFQLPLSSPIQDDVPPALSYLPPVQTPLPIEQTPVPLPAPIQPNTDYLPPAPVPQPNTDYLPPVAPAVGQPNVQTQTNVYNPPAAPITGVATSKLALIGSLVGAKASLIKGISQAKSTLSSGVSGAVFSGNTQGTSGQSDLPFLTAYDTNYGGANYGTQSYGSGASYPSRPYPLYPPYPQQSYPVYPVYYRPKPNPFAAWKAKMARIILAKKLEMAAKKTRPHPSTYSSHPPPTYYPTYPQQQQKIIGFHKFKAPHPYYRRW